MTAAPIGVATKKPKAVATAQPSLLGQLVAALATRRIRVVDLTQTLSPAFPQIALPPEMGQCWPFRIEEVSAYDARGPGWYWNNFSCGEHTGTHFDAPVHWVTGKDLPGNACDTIPPRRFVGPACVIDVTEEAERDPDFLLTPGGLESWEWQHGKIPAGAWVLLRTGWSRKTGAAFAAEHTPGFDAATSKILAHDRDVLGVGVETIGTDAGQAGTFDPPFPNHTIMHGAGTFGLASLCNLDQLPPTGAIVIAAPLKIVNGSGSPLRSSPSRRTWRLDDPHPPRPRSPRLFASSLTSDA
jgi:kynurenine formamidase